MPLDKKHLSYSITAKAKRYLLTGAVCTLLAAVLCYPLAPAWAVQISDDPMDTQVQSGATNIMFVLDNSGSMDWEFLTDDSEGKFEGDIEYFAAALTSGWALVAVGLALFAFGMWRYLVLRSALRRLGRSVKASR